MDELSKRRLAKRMNRDLGTPHLELSMWLDAGGEVMCNELRGADWMCIETGADKVHVLALLLSGTSRTAAMLHEEGGEKAWMAEPVMMAQVIRVGHTVTKPHRFWHDEACAGQKARLRSACWAARQGWKVVAEMWWWCFLLAFKPKKLRELEIE